MVRDVLNRFTVANSSPPFNVIVPVESPKFPLLATLKVAPFRNCGPTEVSVNLGRELTGHAFIRFAR